MANRFQNILALAEKQSRDISASVSAYTAFLQTAGNNYKYSFPNQLLIHAQKPTATACATLEQWNTLGRWINRHAKGIALLPENDRRVRYVFVIADTNSYAGNQVTRWALEPRHKETVAAMLQDRFGASATTVPQLILEAATSSSMENYADYLPVLVENAPDSDRDDDPTGGADGGGTGRDGDTQGERPNALGAADERNSSSGGGNRDARADLQLTLFNPSEKANRTPEAEAEPVSAFAITQEDIDRAVTQLYGSWDCVDDHARAVVEKALTSSNLQEFLKLQAQEEEEAKNAAIEFGQNYPDIITEDNIDAIIQQALKKKREG